MSLRVSLQRRDGEAAEYVAEAKEKEGGRHGCEDSGSRQSRGCEVGHSVGVPVYMVCWDSD